MKTLTILNQSPPLPPRCSVFFPGSWVIITLGWVNTERRTLEEDSLSLSDPLRTNSHSSLSLKAPTRIPISHQIRPNGILIQTSLYQEFGRTHFINTHPTPIIACTGRCDYSDKCDDHYIFLIVFGITRGNLTKAELPALSKQE